MNQKGFVNIIVVIGVIILAGIAGYFIVNRTTLSPTPKPIPTPAPTVNAKNIIKTIGESESSFLIQKINPDSVEGLWSQTYPVARLNGTPKTLHPGDDIGYACEGISEKLISIDFTGQKVTFTKVVSQPPYGGCPK